MLNLNRNCVDVEKLSDITLMTRIILVLYNLRSENTDNYFSSNALNKFSNVQKANIENICLGAYRYFPLMVFNSLVNPP